MSQRTVIQRLLAGWVPYSSPQFGGPKWVRPGATVLTDQYETMEPVDDAIIQDARAAFAESTAPWFDDGLPPMKRATCPVCGCVGDLPLHAPEGTCPCGDKH